MDAALCLVPGHPAVFRHVFPDRDLPSSFHSRSRFQFPEISSPEFVEGPARVASFCLFFFFPLYFPHRGQRHESGRVRSLSSPSSSLSRRLLSARLVPDSGGRKTGQRRPRRAQDPSACKLVGLRVRLPVATRQLAISPFVLLGGRAVPSSSLFSYPAPVLLLRTTAEARESQDDASGPLKFEVDLGKRTDAIRRSGNGHLPRAAPLIAPRRSSQLAANPVNILH